MDPMKRWDLLRPTREYTEKELKFLDEIQKCSLGKRSFRLFDVNRKKMNRDAVVAMSIVHLEKLFVYQNENLCKLFHGTLKMRDLDCIERPFKQDAKILMREDVMNFVIADMADEQHYSLSPQTLIIKFVRDTTGNSVKRLQTLHNMPNPFERDLLIMPTMAVSNQYFTVVKNPGYAFANADNAKPEVYHFGLGSGVRDGELDECSWIPVFERFFRDTSKMYAPEKEYRGCDWPEEIYDFRALEDIDKPVVILSIMHTILSAEYEFPDFKALGEQLMKKSRSEWKSIAVEFRKTIVEMINNYIDPNDVLQEMLDFRQEIIKENNKEQDNTVSSTTD